MEYVYAALLLDAAGKDINEKSIEEVVKAAGMKPDEAQAKAIVASLKGVNIKDVIKNAQSAQACGTGTCGSPGTARRRAEAAQGREERGSKGRGGCRRLKLIRRRHDCCCSLRKAQNSKQFIAE